MENCRAAWMLCCRGGWVNSRQLAVKPVSVTKKELRWRRGMEGAQAAPYSPPKASKAIEGSPCSEREH